MPFLLSGGPLSWEPSSWYCITILTRALHSEQVLWEVYEDRGSRGKNELVSVQYWNCEGVSPSVPNPSTKKQDPISTPDYSSSVTPLASLKAILLWLWWQFSNIIAAHTHFHLYKLKLHLLAHMFFYLTWHSTISYSSLTLAMLGYNKAIQE